MANRKQAEIMRNWPRDGASPLVTVIAVCYCHEKYLRTALDSVLAQETTFPFEVLVHDDASPDGSAAIIQEYAKAYPRIIRPILERENQLCKGILALLQAVQPGIRGKYLAYLDCDDYWTDAHKLQEQVDFLQAHPAFLATAHNCTIVNADGVATGETYPACQDPEYTMDHFLHDILAGQFATFVVRDIFTQAAMDHPLMMTAPPGPFDRVFNLTLLLNGRVHCIQKSMSAYRHVTTGGTSFSATYRFDIKRETRFYLSLALACKRMGRIGDAIGVQRWLVDFLEPFVMRGDIGEAEAAPYLNLCRTSIATLLDDLSGRRKRCNCCGQQVQYAPLPIRQQELGLCVDGLFLPETLNPDAYLCPGCRSLDTERLLVAALERMDLGQKARGYGILQLSPSAALDRWFRLHAPFAALNTCDLGGSEPFQALSAIRDESYDLLLCSHVLERARDDRRVLGELKRIVKEDGCILLLAPVDLAFWGVDEAWGLSEAENQRRFGQGDAVRRYSRQGLLSRLREEFCVSPLGKAFFGDDCFSQAGLSDSSTLYVLTKPGHSPAFSGAPLPQEPAAFAARLTVYIQEPGDACYTEHKKVCALFPQQRRYGGTLSLSSFGTISHIRIDPQESPCFLRDIAVTLVTEEGKALAAPILRTNALACYDGFLFNSDDPQIELSIPQGKYREVSFCCEWLSGDSRMLEYLSDAFEHWRQGASGREGTSRDPARTCNSRIEAQAEVAKLTAQLAAARREYDAIATSTLWKLTKPVRLLLDTLKKLLHIF